MGPRTAWPARHGDRGAVDDQKTFAVLGCTKRRGWGVDMRVTSAVPAMLMTRRRDQLKWPLHRIPALGKQKSDDLCTGGGHVRAGRVPRGSEDRPKDSSRAQRSPAGDTRATGAGTDVGRVAVIHKEHWRSVLRAFVLAPRSQ